MVGAWQSNWTVQPEQLLRVQQAFADIYRSAPRMVVERMESPLWKPAVAVSHLGRVIGAADLVYWESDMWDAATRGAGEAFAATKLDPEWLPVAAQLWVPERAIVARSADPPPGMPAVLRLILVVVSASADRQELQHWGIYVNPKDETPAPYTLGDYQEVGAPIREAMRGVVASARFLTLPFVGRERIPVTRQIARAHERHYEHKPSLQRIILRRRQAAGTETEAERREFACHFLVRGHWRKRAERWGPGSPIYVNPHVKGDTAQPFKPPRERIFHVAR